MAEAFAHVIDASAVLCLLFSETGADGVADIIDGAALSAVNYAEILSKLIERGADPIKATAKLDELPFTLVPLDRGLAEAAARLRPATRAAGLSLGDRCCLALALRLGAVAVTADRARGQARPRPRHCGRTRALKGRRSTQGRGEPKGRSGDTPPDVSNGDPAWTEPRPSHRAWR